MPFSIDELPIKSFCLPFGRTNRQTDMQQPEASYMLRGSSVHEFCTMASDAEMFNHRSASHHYPSSNPSSKQPLKQFVS